MVDYTVELAAIHSHVIQYSWVVTLVNFNRF